MTTQVKWAGALLVAALGLGGCGVDAPEQQEGEELGQQEAALSTTSQSYVVLRADTRRCAAPYCGGYFVKDANRATAEQYVSGLDFRYAGLDAATVAVVQEAPAGELVLRGFLGAQHPTTRLRRFVVTEAYRGMPGVVAAAGEALFKASPMANAPQCFTAPCPSQLARPLNGSTSSAFSSYAVARALRTGVDGPWLTARVQQHGAVVAAVLRNGELFAGGPEQVLDASQVFVRLPDVTGDCRMYTAVACDEGFVSAWTYGADRCMASAGCVPQAYCLVGPPRCEDGYALRAFTDAGGCATGRCEPAFVQ